MKKKLCIFLSFLMLLGLLPVSAFAEDETPSEQDTDVSVEISEQEAQQQPISLSYADALEKLKSSDTYILVDLSNQSDEISYKNVLKSLNSDDEGSYSYKTLKLQKEYIKTILDDNKIARENALSLEVLEKYYSMKSAEDSMKTSEEQVNSSKRSLDTVKKKYELGTASKSDLLEAEISYNQSVNSLTKAENNLKSQQMSFNIYFGYDIDQEIELTDSPEEVTLPAISLDEAEKLAVENRLEMRSSEYSLNKAEANVNHYKVSSAITSTNYLSAFMSYIRARISRDQQESNIIMDVRSKYNTMMENCNAVELSKQNVTKAAEALTIAQKRYEQGLITISSLQSSENSLYSAKLSLNSSILSFSLSVQKFIYSYGVGTQAASF